MDDGGTVPDPSDDARREQRAWSQGFLEGVLTQLQPGDVAIDCGANVGEVSGPIAETGATVFAFGPDPLAFAARSERLAPFPNAHPINAAVSDREGGAVLHRSQCFVDDPLGSTVSSTLMDGKRDADAEGANDVEVEVIDLPAAPRDLQAGRVPEVLTRHAGGPLEAGRPALLELDVEGEELTLLPALHAADLLKGMGCTLVETHQRKFPEQRRDFLQMRREIADMYPARTVNIDWV